MTSALVIVAHPDDETIWMGGTILRNKDWKWTILSLCRRADPDRFPKYMKVCSHYQAKGIISDLDDEHLKPLSITEVEEKIRENLKLLRYDYIFTHGKNGEYGHIRHKEAHLAVTELVKEKKIRCKKLFYFSYELSNQTAPSIPTLRIPIATTKNADLQLELDDNELLSKKNIIQNKYGFDALSFETLSCQNLEAFTSFKD